MFNKKEWHAIWGAMKVDVVTTRVFFDPLAVPLTLLFSKIKWITPNRVSLLALVPGLIGAGLFFHGRFSAGAFGYYLFFLLDSIDGKLARLQFSGSRLGAFYDFAIDRIVIGAMTVGMGFSFVRAERFLEYAFVQGFLLLFFLKDTLDLKWKESAVGIAQQPETSSPKSGFFTRHKIHFKPGQLLACFIMFLAGPVTGAYVLCTSLAIGCVLLSLTHNVIRPLLSFLRTKDQ